MAGEVPQDRFRGELMSTGRVGLGQILVEHGRPDENLARAVDMIGEAAEAGCRLVILPECLDLGWTAAVAPALAEAIPGARSAQLAGAARRCGIHVVAGLTERAGDRVFNSAVLIGPAGELLWKHRKINELDIAPDYATGDCLGVVRTPIGTIGLAICADNFPDSLVFGHALCRMGAQLIASPCAWAVNADHDNDGEPYGDLWEGAYGTLARLYDVTIIGVSNVGPIASGPWQGRKCIGASLAMGPGGRVLARGPYGIAALVTTEVTLRPPLAAGTAVAPALRSRGYTGH
jgi:predicted amidohydrolase